MSTLVRSFIVVAALLGSVSTASATFYGYDDHYGHGYGHGYSRSYGHDYSYKHGYGRDYGYGYGKRWVKVNGHWHKQDVRAFFEQLKRNNGN